MTTNRGERRRAVIGQSTEEAVDAIVAADPTRDPEDVRSALDHVTEDGHVTQAGIEATVSDVAKRLATAETRVELAASALDDAMAAAAAYDDIDVVAARLEQYRSTLDAAASRVDRLGSALASVSTPADTVESVYESVVELREIAADAREAQQQADQLQLDLDDFEAWLADPDRRRRGIEEDVHVVEDTLDTVAGEDVESAEAWVDGVLRLELLSLLVADLRSELAELQTMATRDGVGEAYGSEIERRLTEIESRAGAIRERLEGGAESAWRAQYADRIASFRDVIEAADPPVAWGEVQSELRRARSLDEPYPR